MAIQDAPDGTLWVQYVSVVLEAPTPPEPAHEYPAGAVKRYSGHAIGYQEVVKWTVTDKRVGELKEVSMITDNYAKTVWKLVVGATTVFNNVKIQGPLTMPFFDLRLAALAVVTLFCHSDDVTDIVADGSIVAKEIG
ncbi:hypothetical protein ES703_103062 [subsurface metagenome]